MYEKYFYCAIEFTAVALEFLAVGDKLGFAKFMKIADDIPIDIAPPTEAIWT